MAEIKINEAITGELNALKSAGSTAAARVTLDSASTLPVLKAYLERGRQIADVMDKFNRLIKHDVGQVKSFANAMKQQDNS